MKIETLVLGQLQTNCYLVYDEKAKEGVIIDPADSAEFIVEKIYQLKFNPKAIIATHGHFDHILAAGELQMLLNKSKTKNPNQFSNLTMKQLNNSVSFYFHKNDLFLLKEMNQSASYWLGYSIKRLQPLVIKFLKENDQISFGAFALKVIETPGHTPGSITLQLISTNFNQFQPISTIFSGDTLFKGTIGRYDFSYSSKEKIQRSLKKLFQLSGETIVYPGHGKKTKINNEKKLKFLYAT